MYQKSVTSSPRSTAPTSASGDSEPGSRTRLAGSAPNGPAARERVAGRGRAERLRRATVVDEAARHAGPHELQPALRRALGIEADTDRLGVRNVVGEVDDRVELPLTDAGEGTPLLDRAAVEAVEREECEDVDHARRREHDLVAARLEVGRVGGVTRQARRLLTGSRAVEVGDRRRRRACRPIRAAGTSDAVELGLRRAADRALAGGVGEGDLRALGRAEARGLETIGRGDESRDALGTCRRLGRRRRVVPVIDGWHIGRRRQARPAGIERAGAVRRRAWSARGAPARRHRSGWRSPRRPVRRAPRAGEPGGTHRSRSGG